MLPPTRALVGVGPPGVRVARVMTAGVVAGLGCSWVVVLLVVALVAATAEPLAAQEQRAILDVSMNGFASGQALVILQSADVLIDVLALQSAGLRLFTGRRETRRDVEFVSLASLSPIGVRYEVDESGLALRVTAPPAVFGTTSLSLQEARPLDLRYPRPASAFLNYAVSVQPGIGTDVSTEIGLNLFGTHMQTTVTRTAAGNVLRGLTQATYDDRLRLRRWTLGEAQVNGGVLGGGALVVGLTVAREYGLDPYFVRYPTLGFTTALATPSVIDVYVNDQLVKREQVPPGQLNLSQLAVPQGSGAARFVIRDAFGREQELSSVYYLTNSVLGQGMQEYRYTVGVERQNIGISNATFGPAALLAYHRIGITDGLTVGVRAEGTSALVSGGPVINARLWRLGEFEVAAGASRQHGHIGGAASIGYSYNAKPVTVGASVRSYGAHYATLSLADRDERPRYDASAVIGMQVSRRVSVTLNHTRSKQQGGTLIRTAGDRQRSTWVSLRARLGRVVGLFINARRSSRAGIISSQVEAGLSLSLSARMSATATAASGESDGHLRADVQRSLPRSTGYGFRLRLSDRPGSPGDATLEYQGPFGLYEVDHVREGGSSNTTFRASGGLVAIGGRVFASRVVEESFALLQVPGVAGVRGYASYQQVGRTDGHGNLLIPNLLAYYANIISVNDLDIPLDYRLGDVVKRVAPSFRSGAVVTFSAVRIQAVTGTIGVEIAGQTIVPAYGQLTIAVDGVTVTSPVGLSGEFYFESLAIGPHTATVVYSGGTATCVIDVPKSPAIVVKLGPITCVGAVVRIP